MGFLNLWNKTFCLHCNKWDQGKKQKENLFNFKIYFLYIIELTASFLINMPCFCVWHA